MRILTRYILREVVSHGLLGGLLFTFVLFVGRLGRILDLVVRDSASLTDVLRIIAYLLPDALTVTIPMAVLVGILLGLSRLASDSEITAMRASGMSALDFVRVVSVAALVALGLGLLNSLFLAPRAASALLAIESDLKQSQASFEVQPRVFYEDFKNIVLYVQDVTPAAGAALWHHVFVADLTRPASPNVTTADSAIVVPAGPDAGVRMHLLNGGEHTVSAANPDQYDITTFASSDLPLQAGAVDDTHVSRLDAPTLALPLGELLHRASLRGRADPRVARPYRIELNRRLSYPFACLVLMLVGVPLGLSSKRGGKSAGFVLTIALVVVYYFLSSVGVALARQQKLSPFLGVWGANLLFALFGLILLQQMSAGGVALNVLAGAGARLGALLPSSRTGSSPASPGAAFDSVQTAIAYRLRRIRSLLRIRFPLLLDEYVMREFARNFLIVLLSFAAISVISSFFDLVGDIIRNRTPLVTVGDYLLNLLPFIFDRVVPLCALVAALLTFGALNRSSELTAMKATGISIYRIIAPVLVLTLFIAGGLFAFDELYLPAANRRQEALRSIIKGKPAQTFLRPERKWISGQTSPQTATQAAAQTATQTAATTGSSTSTLAATPPGTTHNTSAQPHAVAGRSALSTTPAPPLSPDPDRIFYYQFFDPDKNVFANLTVFEFQPATFLLQRRIFAASATWDATVSRWIFDNGWQRTFAGETVAGYQPFVSATFPEIREQPGYFKKEDLQSQEMSYNELRRYIDDLKQSGFDTMRLRVQLNHKLAYPAVTFVMALLAIPFALRMGKRGGLAGMATAILIGIVFWGVSSTFEAMGNVNTLPPTLAAWTPDALFALAGAYLLLRTPT